jgi:hypothetical protein
MDPNNRQSWHYSGGSLPRVVWSICGRSLYGILLRRGSREAGAHSTRSRMEGRGVHSYKDGTIAAEKDRWIARACVSSGHFSCSGPSTQPRKRWRAVRNIFEIVHIESTQHCTVYRTLLDDGLWLLLLLIGVRPARAWVATRQCPLVYTHPAERENHYM